MKSYKLILSAIVAAGLFAAASVPWPVDAPATNAPTTNSATSTAPPDGTQTQPPPDAPTPAVEPAPAPAEPPPPTAPAAPLADLGATTADTNTVVDPVTGEIKLRMNFRNVPLEKVLDYMSKAAGYIIHPKVDLQGRVTVWSDQPLNKEEAITLVKQILNENGYTALDDGSGGRTLTIISSSQAKHSDIPVKLGNTPANIPKNTEIVTQIIPVRSLNAVSLVKDLQPLLPVETTLIANETGNALVMTDTQANIHRIAEIVRALDSVSSSSATIIVFPLKFADAKSLASLIKDLFPTASTTAGGSGGGGFFGRFRGFGGGGGGGDAGGGGSDTGAGHTPSSRVTAVSDDHANALVVSAPDDLVPTIKELINSIDTDVQDLTEVRVFAMKNADANEMATLLTNLFPDDTETENNNNNSSGRFRFGLFGGPSQSRNNASSSSESDRMKRMGRVLAVPDARTASLVVSASKDLMPQIAAMIERLDDNPRRKMKVFVYNLENADVQDVQPVLQDLFPSSNNSRNSSTANSLQNNALTTRNQTLQTQQNSSTASPFGNAAGSGARPSF